MKSGSNFGLFFYGIGALAIQGVGLIVLLIGMFGMLYNGWVGLLMIVGLGVIFYGKAQRFDYQRQSGHIMHKGDW